MPQVFISSQTEKEIWENAFFSPKSRLKDLYILVSVNQIFASLFSCCIAVV